MSWSPDGMPSEPPTLRLIEDPEDVGWFVVACVGELSDEAAALWARSLAETALGPLARP